MKIDILEYSWMKATVVSIHLHIPQKHFTLFFFGPQKDFTFFFLDVLDSLLVRFLFPMELDILEYSQMKATMVTMHLQIISMCVDK